MADQFKKDEKVAWDSSQGIIHGKIEEKLTEPSKIKNHAVKASDENPEYVVESAKTGAKAAHKPEELRKDGN